MSNEAKQTLHIDAIYPERGEIILSGRTFQLGERIQLQYYRVGQWQECTIRNDGVVTYMRKVSAPSTPAPATGQSSVDGFTTADQLKSPSPKQPSRDSTPSMVWCNAMTNAIEILKIQWGGTPYSELQEVDLAKLAVGHAAVLYKAGMEHVKAEQHG